jgi:hypothetical protein
MLPSVFARSSKRFIETLRNRITELKGLDATPDTHEELVALHVFLDRLYTMVLKRVRKTLH